MIMFFNYPSLELVVIAFGALILYFLVVGIVYRRRLIAAWNKTLHQPIAENSNHLQARGVSWASEQLLPPLIDKPADHPVEQAGFYDDNDLPDFEIMDDDENVLLKEAEKVVEEIQEVIDHIASSPANAEEVFTKVRNIVSAYTFFMDTEYYDAINSFVAITVQRDCDLSFTQKDLKALWQS
jgi:hypothetical protein